MWFLIHVYRYPLRTVPKLMGYSRLSVYMFWNLTEMSKCYSISQKFNLFICKTYPKELWETSEIICLIFLVWCLVHSRKSFSGVKTVAAMMVVIMLDSWVPGRTMRHRTFKNKGTRVINQGKVSFQKVIVA